MLYVLTLFPFRSALLGGPLVAAGLVCTLHLFTLTTQSTDRKKAYIDRVRTILALGYRVLGHICRYWVVLLLGDISVHCDTQYDTDQTAVGTVHMITILTSVVQP